MTNSFCTCPAAGFCDRHKIKKGAREFALCRGQADSADCGRKYWNAWESGKLGATVPETPQIDPPGFCEGKATVARPKAVPAKTDPNGFPVRVGTILKNKIARLAQVKTGVGCNCSNLAAQMDAGGIKWCEANREFIVQHLIDNKAMLFEAVQSLKASSWVEKVSGSFISVLARFSEAAVTQDILREGANLLLDLSIREAYSLLTAMPVQQLTPSPEQRVLYHKWQKSTPPEADPFTETPVFHLGLHLYPIGEFWKWHVDEWNELADRVTGRCIVCIVVDDSTADIDEVVGRLSSRFETHIAQNTPEGENPSFTYLQDTIPKGPNDVLLYAHGKGARPHTAGSEAVRVWTEMMYETVLFNTERVQEKLSLGYKCFGSFRTFGKYSLNPKFKWHYSGTFFAVRAKHLVNKPVKSGYGGVEAWPGCYFPVNECWNEFADNRPMMSQYHLSEIYPTIVDQQMQWESDRFTGPRIEQHKRELDWFLKFLNETDRVLVIGSKHGGLEHQLVRVYPKLEIVSADISPQEDNAYCRIIGSSHDEETRAEIQKHGPYDVVFVDGDHSYEGVRKDWEFSKSLNPRIVAFHDIAVAVKHRNEGCEVDVLWGQIKTQHKTSEKTVGCGWGGIGVVFLR